MFSNNEKISERQMIRLLIMDWTGKFCLFLPILISPVRGVEEAAAFLMALIAAYFYTRILGYVARSVSGTFSGYLRERLGRVVSKGIGILFVFYLLLNQIYLTRAVGRVSTVFLLPENSEIMIGILFLAAGWMTARGSVQKRARMAEVLLPILAVMLMVMLAACVPSIQWDHLNEAVEIDIYHTVKETAILFVMFSGMSVTLYQVPYLGKKMYFGTALKKGVFVTGIFQFLLFWVMLGAFGKHDFSKLEWPVLVLMSNVNIPGGFLQRWDIIFLAALLFSLFTASGTGIYYMGKILSENFPGGREDRIQIYCTGICAAAALLAGNYENAERIFVRWALCACLPMLAAIPVLLAVLERVIQCKKLRK